MNFEIVSCIADGRTDDLVLRRLATAIQLLPPGSKLIFQRLMMLFVKIHSHSDKNLMTANNLAIVFAPAFLRYEVLDLTLMLAHAETSNRVILLCIENYEILFEVSQS